MKKMTKKEQVLALKTIEARKVKQETMALSKRSQKKASRSTVMKRPSTAALDVSKLGITDSTRSVDSPGRGPQSSPQPQLNSCRSDLSESYRNVEKFHENKSSTPNLDLSKELSHRGLTHEAYVRKMTNEALSRANQTSKANADDNDIFFPKVRKVRADGASLSQVYESKKEDVWGKILKEQLAEEERENAEKRIRKDIADANYGKALKKQLNDKKKMEQNSPDRADVMVKAKGVWDQFETRNKDRLAEKNKKHEIFVANALEDMEKKRNQRYEELQRELEGSAYLTRKAEAAIAAEKERAAQQRKAQAEEQNRLLMENYALMEKRRREREKKHEEDRKYVREMEEKFQRDEERRQAEVDKKAASNSLDRGAYVLASKLNEEKMRATNEFFSKNQNAANLLNTTLLMSEQKTQDRIESNKAALKREFAEQRRKDAERKDDRGAELAQQRAKMDEAQRQYKRDLEREKREKMKAAATYQNLLDAQLSAMRQRSLDSLQETMAEKEKTINSSLLEKYGIPVKKN